MSIQLQFLRFRQKISSSSEVVSAISKASSFATTVVTTTTKAPSSEIVSQSTNTTSHFDSSSELETSNFNGTLSVTSQASTSHATSNIEMSFNQLNLDGNSYSN